MCTFCDNYGRTRLAPRTLKKVMAEMNLEAAFIDLEHMRELIDLWSGFEAGPESEADAEAAEAWERGHRG